MSRSSKRKGADGERELRAHLREHLGEVVERTGYQQAHRGGWDLTLPNLGVEVKRYKTIRDCDVREFWEQTSLQMQEHGVVGVLAYRQDAQCWRFVAPHLGLNAETGNLVVVHDLDMAVTYYTRGFCAWYARVIQPEPEDLRLKVH